MDSSFSNSPTTQFPGLVRCIGIGTVGEKFAADLWASRHEHPQFDSLYDRDDFYVRGEPEVLGHWLDSEVLEGDFVARVAKHHLKALRNATVLFVAIAADAGLEHREEARALGALARSNDVLCIVLLLKTGAFSGVNVRALGQAFALYDANILVSASLSNSANHLALRWLFIALTFMEHRGLEMFYPSWDIADVLERWSCPGVNLVMSLAEADGEGRAEQAAEAAIDALYWVEGLNLHDALGAVVVVCADGDDLMLREIVDVVRITQSQCEAGSYVLPLTPRMRSVDGLKRITVVVIAAHRLA